MSRSFKFGITKYFKTSLQPLAYILTDNSHFFIYGAHWNILGNKVILRYMLIEILLNFH